MTEASVSVIIPTYNRKNTILRTIESVLKQTIKPYEILICDDGSIDGTKELVKGIKDKRIKWISAKHSGLPGVPRNRGIRKSKGEWLAFLDSDDWWFPTKLENQLNLAQKTGLSAVSSNAILMRQQNNIGQMLDYSKNAISFLDLIDTNYIICSSATIHRSLLKKCVGFPEDPSLQAIEDYALWLRIATQTPFGYIREPLVYYNDDIRSVRAKGPQTLKEQKEIIFRDFLRWVKQKKNLSSYRREVETAFRDLYP